MIRTKVYKREKREIEKERKREIISVLFLSVFRDVSSDLIIYQSFFVHASKHRYFLYQVLSNDRIDLTIQFDW